MAEDGRLLRLFPVPFRLVEDPQKFKKWQWISARVRRAQDDQRPESHRISVDTIAVLGEPLPKRDAWAARLHAVAGVAVFDDFDGLETARQARGVSLALLRPSRLVGMDITPVGKPDWTADEVAKLMQAQLQGSLFDAAEEQRSLKLLKKLPFDFHYRFECQADGVTRSYRKKVADWEAGALYWNVCRKPDWQAAFRQKFVSEFAERDVLFLMGTIHRFPNQWLIVSVLYPPRPPAGQADQALLF
jgi:hypothetical protein